MKIKTKLFLYTTLMVSLILTLSLATLYYVMPQYYAAKQRYTVEKIGEEISQKVKGDPFSAENRRYFEEISLQTNANIFVSSNSRLISFPNFRIILGEGKETNLNDLPIEFEGSLSEQELDPSLYQTYTIEKKDSKQEAVKIVVGLANQPVSDAAKVLLDLYPALLLGNVLIGMAGAYLSSSLSTKRITAISKRTKRMARDLQAPLNEVKGRDEIKELADDINRLYLDLQTTIESLNQELMKTAEIEVKKAEFMRAASHELKTPVAALGGLLDAMIYRVGEFQDRDKYLVEAKKIVDQQNQLIQDILTISKMDLIDPQENVEEISLKALFAEILPTYYMMAKTKELVVETAFDDSQIVGNQAALKRICHNLLTNMIRYTPDHGQVQLKVSNQQLIFRNSLAADQQLDCQQMMEAFYRPDFSRNRTFGGSGLGLYIVKQLAEHHHWQLEVQVLTAPQSVEVVVIL